MLYESVKAALDAGNALEFRPLPTIDDRAAWINLDPEVYNYFNGIGRDLGDYRISMLPASLYADFTRTGNRARFQKLYFERRRKLFELIVCECIENSGRFIDLISDTVWAICEETTWVIPAHLHHDPLMEDKNSALHDACKPYAYFDLFSAETGALLAWVRYLLGNRLDATAYARIGYENRSRILTPFVEHPEMHWCGLVGSQKLNNWTPWIYSNLLVCDLLMNDSLAERSAIVLDSAKGIDAFLATYSEDGGCDEGPSYFGRAGASVLDCLEILDIASGGAIDIYSEPLIHNMAGYIMYANISDDYYVNFADCACRVSVDYTLLARAAARMGYDSLKDYSEAMLRNGSFVPYRAEYDVSFRRLMNALSFRRRDLRGEKSALPLSHCFEGIQVALARQNADGSGMFFAAKGGHNNESHNHNDVGSYLIYCDGRPFIIDAGVETYRRETFSSQRYNIWTMQSRFHNTAIIGDTDQYPGADFKARDFAFTDDGAFAVYSADIAPAYGDFAGIEYYRRKILLDRAKGEITLTDDYALTEPLKVTLPVMCIDEPRIAPGEVQLGGKLRISYNPRQFAVSCRPITLTDAKLRDEWRSDRLYRLLFEVAPSESGTLELRFAK